MTGTPRMTVKNILCCISHLGSLSLTCSLLRSADFFSCVLTFSAFVVGCSGSLFLSRLFSVCSEQGCSLLVMHECLTALASLVVEQRL